MTAVPGAVVPAVAAAIRAWAPGLYFPSSIDRDPLVPWLAPDGREWGARRLTRLPYVAESLRPLARAAGVFVPPSRTPVSRAIRLLLAENNVGPLGRAALWALYR